MRDSNIPDVNLNASVFITACGYESRSSALIGSIGGPSLRRIAIGFNEWSEALARPTNEKIFRENGFEIFGCGNSDAPCIRKIVRTAMDSAQKAGGALAIDISAMTRAWHGAIVRELATASLQRPELQAYFIYVPAQYQGPPRNNPPNEVVAPVEGFVSLAPPDLPVAAIIGLGYERERALGLQQFLDPQHTALMIPRSGKGDRFYAAVRSSNIELLNRTAREWTFEYSLAQPSATFHLLSSVVGGLRSSFRVVIASLGPKLFGVISFLLAAQDSNVSVWRVSAGVHGAPREVKPDLDKVIVLSTTWRNSS